MIALNKYFFGHIYEQVLASARLNCLIRARLESRQSFPEPDQRQKIFPHIRFDKRR